MSSFIFSIAYEQFLPISSAPTWLEYWIYAEQSEIHGKLPQLQQSSHKQITRWNLLRNFLPFLLPVFPLPEFLPLLSTDFPGPYAALPDE